MIVAIASLNKLQKFVNMAIQETNANYMWIYSRDTVADIASKKRMIFAFSNVFVLVESGVVDNFLSVFFESNFECAYADLKEYPSEERLFFYALGENVLDISHIIGDEKEPKINVDSFWKNHIKKTEKFITAPKRKLKPKELSLLKRMRHHGASDHLIAKQLSMSVNQVRKIK